MANAWCINAYDCNGCLIQTLQNLDSACIGVGVQYTAPNPLDDKRLDYIKYTDKCWCVQCLSAENEILIYATNGVIKNLTLTNDDVNEAIKIKWNDIFWSNRAKTIVRYKTWSYPTSITDWTLAVEETTKNQYSSTPFSLSGVLDETTYYISAFAVDSNGIIINVQSSQITTDFWWKPTANTLARYKLETDANDYSWNWRNLTNNNVSFVTQSWVKSAYFTWSASSPLTQLTYSNFYNLSSWDYTINFRAYKLPQASWWSEYGDRYAIWMWSFNNSYKWWSMILEYDDNRLRFAFWYDDCDSDINPWNQRVNIWVKFKKSTNQQFIYVNWVLRNSRTTTYTHSLKVLNLCIWWRASWNTDNNWKWYLSKIIFEKVWWSDSEFLEYFNKTRSKYWI